MINSAENERFSWEIDDVFYIFHWILVNLGRFHSIYWYHQVMTSQKEIMTSSHDDITKNCDITKIIRFLGILTEIEFILRKKFTKSIFRPF